VTLRFKRINLLKKDRYWGGGATTAVGSRSNLYED